MRHITRKQTRIIQGSTAEGFQDELNKALAEIAGKGYKHELQFNNNAGLCAYIIYDERVAVSESLADEYELRGEEFRCYECPMYVLSEDKRIKFTTCKHGCRRVAANDFACEWFYQELEKGGIKPL